MAGNENQLGNRAAVVRFRSGRRAHGPDRIGLDEVRSALAAAAHWANTTDEELSVNLPAVRAALGMANHWLDTDAPLTAKLDDVHQDLIDVAKAHLSFDWLFDEQDQPKLDTITGDVFERLIELRVVTDRIIRALSE